VKVPGILSLLRVPFHQVLLNLLLNAVQAMAGAGTVLVEIGSLDDCAHLCGRLHHRVVAPRRSVTST